MKYQTSNYRFLLPMVIFGASLFYYLSYANQGLILGDWGMILVAAERLLEGDVFYRDFSIIYTPGIYLYTAFAFKIFGVSLSSALIGWSILRAFNCLLIYCIGNRIISEKKAILLALMLWLVPGSIHKSFYVFFLLLNLYMLLGLLVRKEGSYHYFAGIIVGITLIIRTDLFGISIITFFVICLLKIIKEWKTDENRVVLPIKKVSLWCIGIATGVSPFLIYLLVNNALTSAYEQTFQYADIMKSLWFYLPPLSQVFDSKRNVYTYLGVIIPFGFYFISSVILITIIKTNSLNDTDEKILVIYTCGILTLNQVIMIPNLGRVSVIFSPVLIACLYFMEYYGTIRNKCKSLMNCYLYKVSLIGLTGMILLFTTYSILTPDLYTNGSIFRQLRIDDKIYLENPKLRVYADRKEAEKLRKVVMAIYNLTGENEYVFSFLNNHQLFNFVTGRKTLEKYGIVSEYIISEERQRKVMRLLDEKNIRMILVDKNKEKEFRLWAPLLSNYIFSHYDLKSAASQYMIYFKSKNGNTKGIG